MLDVIIPAFYGNISMLPKCLYSLSKNTDCEFNVIVSTQGCTVPESDKIGNIMADMEIDGFVIGSGAITGEIDAVEVAFAETTNDLIAVLYPWGDLMDDQWVGKMQLPFMKAPAVGVSFVPGIRTEQRTLPAVPVTKKSYMPDTPLMLFPREVLEMNMPMFGKGFFEEYSNNCFKNGCGRFEAPGVDVDIHDHEDHPEVGPRPSSSRKRHRPSIQ